MKRKKKTVLTAIQKAWRFKGFLKSDNIDDVKNAVNNVVAIHNEHESQIKAKEIAKDFKPVEGVDFNTWAYTQLTQIEALYFDLKSKYHDLHFDKHQFNAY